MDATVYSNLDCCLKLLEDFASRARKKRPTGNLTYYTTVDKSIGAEKHFFHCVIEAGSRMHVPILVGENAVWSDDSQVAMRKISFDGSQRQLCIKMTPGFVPPKDRKMTDFVETNTIIFMADVPSLQRRVKR